MPYDDSRKRAIMKYQKENFDPVMIRFPKGERDRTKDHAALMGESMAKFILRAISETIERDRSRIRETLKNAPKEEPIEEE